MLDKVRNPILFQGDLIRADYFEGWYYKQVSADQKTSLSFIPAVSLNEHDAHSFIQYILVQQDTAGKTTTHTGYVRHSVEDFEFQDSPFAVRVGKSLFTERMISIDVADDTMQFKGDLVLGELHPIQTSVMQPNIMGIFGYIPKMECYHGVISMTHSLEGSLTLNGTSINFSGGKGYIEKDWGTSFPKRYIWLQSNHFDNPTASLFFSIAHIPFHFTEFEGFICNLVLDDKEYRFATYNLSRCKLEDTTAEYVQISLENKHATLDIRAQVSERGELIAPVNGTMIKTVKEGISGNLTIRLEDKKTSQIYEDTGHNAGVEIVDYGPNQH